MAGIDQNRVKTFSGLLNTDGVTPQNLTANPTTHGLKINDGTTGSNLSGNNAGHDDNHDTTMTAFSSADGTTIIPLYITSSGQLLIQST